MDLTKLSKTKLLEKCEELGITKCKSKNKHEMIDLINKKLDIDKNLLLNNQIKIIKEDETIEKSKYTLVDLFCGTGAFSYAFH
jgi:hypothetical protein